MKRYFLALKWYKHLRLCKNWSYPDVLKTDYMYIATELLQIYV